MDLDETDEEILKGGVSMWFDFDIMTMKENPFMKQTPFGTPCTIGKGDVFSERDMLEEALRDACERLEHAGYPAKDLEAILERSHL